jgi:hypothetical protein
LHELLANQSATKTHSFQVDFSSLSKGKRVIDPTYSCIHSIASFQVRRENADCCSLTKNEQASSMGSLLLRDRKYEEV